MKTTAIVCAAALLSCIALLPVVKAGENEKELADIGRTVFSAGGTFVDLLAQIAGPLADLVQWIGDNAGTAADIIIQALNWVAGWAGGFSGDKALGDKVASKITKIGNLLVKEGLPALKDGAVLIRKGSVKLKEAAEKITKEAGVKVTKVDLKD